MSGFAAAMIALALIAFPSASVAADFESDTFDTGKGSLTITFFGHASLMLEFAGKVIQVDPVGRYADYAKQPPADIILITHEHGDHLDPDALAKARKPTTLVIANPASAGKIVGATAMANGESRIVEGVKIEAVPAYNIEHKRDDGEPFHPKGRDNGYVLTFGDKRVYIAGDTENTPEMKALKNIDIAFLPMNLPYTMTPEMVADAARAFRPEVLYPYHFGSSDTAHLVELLKGEKGIEVRLRKME